MKKMNYSDNGAKTNLDMEETGTLITIIGSIN